MKKMMLVLAGACLSCFSAMAQVVVIVNPSMNEVINKDEITRVYTGRSSVLVPMNIKESDPKRAVFDEKALGRSSAQLKAYWSKLVFTGKGNPPQEAATDEEVIAFVSANEYGIGYIDASKVNDNVKVILTLD